jgi:hypothetical protein
MGTKQRCAVLSPGFHQCLSGLRMLLTKPASELVGEGKPQRIDTSSRVPSGATRITGADCSGRWRLRGVGSWSRHVWHPLSHGSSRARWSCCRDHTRLQAPDRPYDDTFNFEHARGLNDLPRLLFPSDKAILGTLPVSVGVQLN